MKQMELEVPLPRPRARRAAEKKVAAWATKVEDRVREHRSNTRQDPWDQAAKEEQWARGQVRAERHRDSVERHEVEVLREKNRLEEEARNAQREGQKQRQQEEEKEKAAREAREVQRREEELRREMTVALPKSGKTEMAPHRQGEDKPRLTEKVELQEEKEARQRELLALKAKVPESLGEVNNLAKAVSKAEAKIRAAAKAAQKVKKKNDKKMKKRGQVCPVEDAGYLAYYNKKVREALAGGT
jgi:hypothetical protein